jgi:chaperonin GroEL
VCAVTREAAVELGDGTKTAGLIFAELVLKGFSELKQGAVLRELVHEMDIAVEATVNYLGSLAKNAKDQEELEGVATTAALGESLSSNIVNEAMRRAGTDGVVLVEDAGGLETTLTVREGMYFERGYLTDRFITDQFNQKTVLEDCHVLVSAETIRTVHQILPTMEIAARTKQSLLVIAPDVEAEVLEILAANCQKQLLISAAVKAPGHPSRPEVLEDIAVCTGGVVVRLSAQLNQITAQQLGFAKRVEVSKDSTWIVNGRSSEQMLRSRAAGIRQQILVGKNGHEKEYLQERLAKLTGAVSVINVGGASTVDREERKYRIVSAIHAVRSAMTGGVIPGGGSSLWRAHLLAVSDRGAALLIEALIAPIYAQIKNARLPVKGIVDELIKHLNNPEIGFDARELKVENLAKTRVLDPTSIVIRQLQIAFGHARKVLQTGGWDVSRFYPKAPPQ